MPHFHHFHPPGFCHGQAADYNIVNLDNNTLKMLTGKDVPAFVRFDRDYPYGEKVGEGHRFTLWMDHNDINQDDTHTHKKGETNDWVLRSSHIVILVDTW